MPSSSTLHSEEKDKIKKAIQSGKIVAAAIARIYYAYPDPDEWAYSGIEGALVFGAQQDSGFWLRLVDLTGTRGVIWEHEFYEGFEFNQDRTFFYSFAGDECMIGFAFADESEAADLNKKVNNRKKYAGKVSSSSKRARSSFMPSMPTMSMPSLSLSSHRDSSSVPSPESSPKQPEKSKRKRLLGGLFDRSSIGGPKEFKHVAHLAVDENKNVTNDNVDPSWEKLLTQLSGFGISREFAENNRDFIADFIKDAGLNEDGSPMADAGAAPATPSAEHPSRLPPPPPSEASAPSRPNAPPPPPPPGPGAARSGLPPAAPPPPPPAGRAPTAPPPPPPGAPPGRPGAPPPPPPPGPPPARSGGPPPPPPPPAGGRSGAPPPPPPPSGRAPASPRPSAPGPPAAALPPAAATAGRADLLAAIRGKGGASALKKVDDSSPSPSAPAGARGGTESGSATPGAAEGAGLAAALAAALTVRRAGTGDSDEEADSDDEWDD